MASSLETICPRTDRPISRALGRNGLGAIDPVTS